MGQWTRLLVEDDAIVLLLVPLDRLLLGDEVRDTNVAVGVLLLQVSFAKQKK